MSAQHDSETQKSCVRREHSAAVPGVNTLADALYLHVLLRDTNGKPVE